MELGIDGYGPVRGKALRMYLSAELSIGYHRARTIHDHKRQRERVGE